MTPAEVEVLRRTVESADAHSATKYVIIVGEEPKGPAPTLTLSRALGRLGETVRFVAPNQLERSAWVRMLRSASAIVLLSYGEVGPYLLSQLATAVAMDIPIIRWWVGTDVLNVTTRSEVRRNASRVDGIVSTNVAVAPHLVDELSTIGVRAQYVASVIDSDVDELAVAEWGGERKPVLVYLPGRRKEFFGIAAIEPVIAGNPDIPFVVIADETHSLATYANVESLGWVSDMQPLYSRAGCVLRITEHDGLPRMLIEGMLRGLYAIYAWPLPGSWMARTSDEISGALSRYREMTSPNLVGREAMVQMLNERPDLKMSEVISDATIPLSQRIRGLSLAVRTKLFADRFR